MLYYKVIYEAIKKHWTDKYRSRMYTYLALGNLYAQVFDRSDMSCCCACTWRVGRPTKSTGTNTQGIPILMLYYGAESEINVIN
jgi:hypothetical protein